MTGRISFPLHERIPRKNTIPRALTLLILFLLFSLLFYRVLHIHSHGTVGLLAFLCESWFTFIWVLNTNARWNPIDQKTYPDRLLERFQDLPPVDMFVTTADPLLEPPILTVNTVLSLLAVDYPSHKLACYVSDDGASPITFYSLIEACKFAKLWVPFCKKYGVRVRAPFMYFSTEPEMPAGHSSDDFVRQWKEMKDQYEELDRKITEAVQKSSAPDNLMDHFEDFSNINRQNHRSIVKVIWENKEKIPNGIPHLVYVAREKRPKQPHHFKAGAMNVLTRVSGVMTNAPFMLNVDCDMFNNNPKAVLHAMCFFLGHHKEIESGFVQFPQVFYGGIKDDPFGNQLVVSQECVLRGMAGIQGPMYAGTGCFHRRKVIYGKLPDCKAAKSSIFNSINGKLHENALDKGFGHTMKFSESVARIMSGKYEESSKPSDFSTTLEAAKEVADCKYEFNTRWGKEVGWVYGSMAEDVITGLKIHSMGWGSVYCSPELPAFLGSSPVGGPATLSQMKRWVTGLLEILVSEHSPLLATFSKNLSFRQSLVYVFVNVWALRSIPELCYAALPAFCLLTNTSFLPKVSDPWMIIAATLFISHNLHGLMEYLQCGLSVRTWWNNQRMSKITSATACLFGFLGVIQKLLGLSETMFEVTRKDQSTTDSSTDVDAGRFTFDSSPIFVPATAIVLVHMTALAVGMLGVWLPVFGGPPGLGEMVCSTWVVLSFFPFVKGLFAKEGYGIPWPTICKAAALAFLFLNFCNRFRSS
ncbi:cellulose synthase-like protein H1 isoform X1 [Magnolia sinica]|uniref:cellulose synthase-like protein H1 isoform X1 n=1 Tax=Magnolia sinica TaxID=86752 RepID=UPI0026591499|nr:cellulose synthase-like protein H1 isoform X1 [Magnolia sinica]